MNKSLEKLAMVVIVLWCVSLIPNPIMQIIAGRIYLPSEFMEFNALRSAYASISIILQLAVNIGVGVWLFIQTRRNGGTPWLWALLGLTTGLSAAILYCLDQIRIQLSQQEKK